MYLCPPALNQVSVFSQLKGKTLVSAKGSKLSGGQKQRVAIARWACLRVLLLHSAKLLGFFFVLSGGLTFFFVCHLVLWSANLRFCSWTKLPQPWTPNPSKSCRSRLFFIDDWCDFSSHLFCSFLFHVQPSKTKSTLSFSCFILVG